MMARQEWHCWQITSCGNEEHCPAGKKGDGNRPCWEVTQELNDYRSALAVCRDCLVFITKEEHGLERSGYPGDNGAKKRMSPGRALPAKQRLFLTAGPSVADRRLPGKPARAVIDRT